MGVAISTWLSGSGVGERVNTRGAIAIEVAGRSGDVDALAVVRVGRALTALVRCANADDTLAVGRRVVAHIVIRVACRRYDGDVARDGAVDGRLQCRSAHSEGREGEVDDIRRGRIVGDTRD